MYTIKQPSEIIFGKFSVRDYIFPKKCLVITSEGSESRGWLEYSKLKNAYLFENVEPNPSMNTVEKIILEFNSCLVLSHLILSYQIISYRIASYHIGF